MGKYTFLSHGSCFGGVKRCPRNGQRSLEMPRFSDRSGGPWRIIPGLGDVVNNHG